MPQRSTLLSPRPSSPWARPWLGIGLAVAILAAPPVTADLEVVFLMDTTGSMGGELREVKERVGQLAASLAEAREGETLRLGAVAYRDRGDKYVTLVSPLTTDFEATESFLAALRADGGGDGPESAVAGVATALSEIHWDFGPGVERQIFLIGDAPPHLDYDDEPKPSQLIEEARRLGIVIHSIGCRSLPAKGVAFFRRLAFHTEGSYQHIGRVRSGQTGVAEALLKAAVPSVHTASFDRGQEVTLTWLDRRRSLPQPNQPSTGILVRPGDADTEGRTVQGIDTDTSCTVEILTPAGFDLEEAPRGWLGPDGLTIEIRPSLNPNTDPTRDTADDLGSIDLFHLNTCPPLGTAIRLTTGGN
ncbi:MAG: VWA domain-containing protein [Deltaproteobacteria bacterium]|nr:VWA domain-containing protein [Deltaproteobacteria bacterium]